LARVRSELGSVERERGALEPRALEAEAAQETRKRVRLEVEAQLGVSPELTVEPRELRGAEDALREADAVHRRATVKRRAGGPRGDARARARRAHAAVGAARSSEGRRCLGPLVDLLEIDEGCEIAVAAALGDALKAIVSTATTPPAPRWSS